MVDENEGRTVGPRVRSGAHPRFSLKDAEGLAREVFDQGVHHVDQDNVAQGIGYSGVKNGSYKGVRAAARYFEMVSYTKDEFISLEQGWAKAMAEGGEKLQRARKEAALKPELYQQLAEKYPNKQLPNPQRLAQELVINTEYGIRKDAASRASETFLETMRFAGLVDENGFLRIEQSADGDEERKSDPDAESRLRARTLEAFSLFGEIGAGREPEPPRPDQEGERDDPKGGNHPKPYRVKLELDDCTLWLEVRKPLPRMTKEVLKAAVAAAPEEEREA